MNQYTSHENPALREHRRRFRFTGRQGYKLRQALATLEECDEALRIALVAVGCQDVATADVCSAIRLLVYGEKGQFR